MIPFKHSRWCLALLVLPLTVQSQTPEDDRRVATAFEKAFAEKIDSIQQAPGVFRYPEGNAYAGKFGRIRCEVANAKFDVRRTASLVTPYSAPISFDVNAVTYGTHADSLSAVLAAPDTSGTPWIIRFDMTYLWRDGVWRYSEGKAGLSNASAPRRVLYTKAEYPLWPEGIADDNGLSLFYRRCIDKQAWSSIRVNPKSPEAVIPQQPQVK